VNTPICRRNRVYAPHTLRASEGSGLHDTNLRFEATWDNKGTVSTTVKVVDTG
jgi:hypothetical protein